MTLRRRLRSLTILAIVPALAIVFWLTALFASNLPAVLVVGVNVHGLSLTSNPGSGLRPAPLSLSVLDDARQDASTPLTTPTASPAPTLPASAASARPTPDPTTTSFPLPLPTPSLPAPTPSSTTGSATISGQVTDSQTRVAIVGATVSASPGGMAALTDINGNFSFKVDPGTYTVTASASTYNSASQTATVKAGQLTSLAFKLVSSTAFGSIRGTVIDASTRAPIVGATVTLSNGLIRVTDASGNFSYDIVLNGSYTLAVSALGYLTQNQPVSVKSSHTTNVQITLTHS